MSVTIVDLRLLVDAPGADPYPASNYTLHKNDWDKLRESLRLGSVGIYPKGIKLGSEGLEVIGTTPVLLPNGSILRFLDGGNSNAVKGSISHDGEWWALTFRVGEYLRFTGGAGVVYEGLITGYAPEAERSHQYLYRGATLVEDLDLFHDGDLFGLRALAGTFWSTAAEHGFAFTNSNGVSQVYMDDDGRLILRDVVASADRPWAYTNERVVVTADPSAEWVANVISNPGDGIEIIEVQASPRILQLRVPDAGIYANHLKFGVGALDVNVDAIWAGGGGAGALATLVTPAQRSAIDAHTAQIAAIQAELATCIKILQMGTDQVVPTDAGVVYLANSSAFIFDKTGPNTVRGTADAGGGGGGGAVDSVTPGVGMGNSGTTANPILNVLYSTGLKLSSNQLVPDFGTAAGKVAEGNHTHTGVYSPVAHTHAGVYIAVGGAYSDLVNASKIGQAAGTLAAGDDARIHAQNTDTGTASLLFTLRRSFAGTPANGDIGGIVLERGLEADARIYFSETLNQWVAGLAGSEEEIVLTSDWRLSDARTPVTHGLDSAEHSGDLAADRVSVVYNPLNYTGGVHVEEHLVGIDSKLGTVITTSHGLLGGQTFSGVGLSSALTGGQFLLGLGADGVKALTAGVITSVVLQGQTDLAMGSAVQISVKNATSGISAGPFPISAGQSYIRHAAALAVAQGDEVQIIVMAVAGVPNCGLLSVHAIKTA